MNSNSFQDLFSEEIWAVTYKDHKDTCLDDTFRRVAKCLAGAETTPEKKAEWEKKFFDLLSDFKAVPGGRILANAGTEWGKVSFINCFVTPLPDYDIDSIDSIYTILKDQANTLKSEGGYGICMDPLRPRGGFIEGVGVESPGSVKFMELFDKSSEIVTAGSGRKSVNKKAKGKIRKGAQMAILSCWHPDVVEFITAKQTPGRLTKFNMSVNCTAEFMARINRLHKLSEEGITSYNKIFQEYDRWDLVFPDTTYPSYKKEWRGDLAEWKAKGYPIVVHRTVSALWLWNLIMESTYNRNEPGVIFLDRANDLNPISSYGVERIFSTNPCGEQVLSNSGVCCLGSLNLTQFVDVEKKGFDLEKIKKYAEYLVRFLDNVNTISDAPLKQYKDSMMTKRRIGCGFMGWGSSLLMLKVRIGSQEAEELRESLTSTFARAAYEASIDLAEERGMFPLCNPELHAEAPFVKALGLSEEYMAKLRNTGIRNSAVLSHQPTGNTSILANVVSGGIEPVFMPEYVRTVILADTPLELEGQVPNFVEGVYEETDLFKWVKEGDEDILKGVGPSGTVYKIDRNRGLTKEVLCQDYGVRYLSQRGEWDPSADWAKTTTELSVQDHVNDLKGFARWVDSSVSKTCNLPNDYPFEEFKNLYLDVYNTGVIKGFTTYRSGTMTSVLSAKDEKTAEDSDEEVILEDVQLPDSLPATLKTIRAESRKWYLTVILNEAQTRPVALFVQTNAHEKNIVANDAVEQLVELAKSKGVPTRHVDSALAKMSQDNNPTKICRCISLNLRHGVLIRSIVSALEQVDCIAGSFVFHIRKFLATFIKDGEKVSGEVCLSCGSANVVYQEGCKVCKNCGSSKCG